MVVGKEGVPVVVRFPRAVLNRITAAAARAGRSRNSEVVLRLMESLKKASNKK